jgi:hypothetical protein
MSTHMSICTHVHISCRHIRRYVDIYKTYVNKYVNISTYFTLCLFLPFTTIPTTTTCTHSHTPLYRGRHTSRYALFLPPPPPSPQFTTYTHTHTDQHFVSASRATLSWDGPCSNSIRRWRPILATCGRSSKQSACAVKTTPQHPKRY